MSASTAASKTIKAPSERLAFATAGRPRVLMLASEAELQYRVLRCIATADVDVLVAGPPAARSLAISRFCAGFIPFSLEWQADSWACANTLNGIAKNHTVALVFPSDEITTRLLANLKPQLNVPVFPVPDADSFAELATKDRFRLLCRRLGVPHPDSTVFLDRYALIRSLDAGEVRLPAIVKPVDSAGSIGVVRIDRGNARAHAETIEFTPILVQDFIEGEDRCITAFCNDGEILNEAIYSHPAGVFRFAPEPILSRIVADIAARMKLNGVINFDARVARDGAVWMIECNPRFFYSMDVAMIAGLNFAWPSDVRSVPDCTIRLPSALARHVARLGRPSMLDWKMLAHWLRDPAMFALAASGYQRRWFSPALEEYLTLAKHKAAMDVAASRSESMPSPLVGEGGRSARSAGQPGEGFSLRPIHER